MKAHSSYIPVQSEVPFRGLATTLPADRIPSGYASDLLNVVVRDGVVRRRSGYLKLGQTLDGIPLDFQEFAKIGSVDVLICFTSLAQYYFDAANNNWVDISIETPWTYAIDAVNTGNKTFEVSEDLTTASKHLSVGTKFVVVGSTGNDGTYTVVTAASSPTTITVSEIIPNSTADGNIIVTRRETIASANAGTDTFTVAIDTTGYMSVGDTIYVKDSANNDGVYTIKTISESGGTTTIVTNEDFTSSSTSGYITHRVDRTYSDGDFLNSTPAVDINSKRLLHTNGVNNPIQWFGDTTDEDGYFLRWVPLLVNFDNCKTIVVFKEHLMLGGVETSADEPQLIAWSDSGDFEDFSNGNSGSQLLYELTTGIEQLVTLGDRVIVYSKDALASGIFIGQPFIFAFETIIPAGTRLASAKGISSINVGHIYASDENFYLFDGSRGLRSLADIIRTDYKDQRDQDTIHQMAAINDYSKRTIYVAVPTLDALGMVYTVEYDAFDLRRRSWSKEQYSHRPRAFGFFTNTFVYTWADTTQEALLATALGLSFLPWSHEIGPWSNEGEQADFPVRIFGDSSGNVYASNEGTLSDNGTVKDGFWTSQDFTVPQEFLSTEGRWGEIEFEASGDDITLEAFGDFGSRLVHSETVVLEGSITQYRIPIDATSRTLRVKFTFSGAFELRWLRCWVKSTSPRS